MNMLCKLNIMIFAVVFAFAGSLFAQTPPAGSPVARHGQLKVVGSQILDQNNRPVQLRGMSLFWSNAPEARDFYNEEVVVWLRDEWKASLIRAAMAVEANWGNDQTGYIAGNNSGGVKNDDRLKTVVNAAIKHGMYVIIDWHSHEAERHTNQAVSFFQEMAALYKDYPNVIYEIYNEPVGPVIWDNNLREFNADSVQAYWNRAVKPYSQTVVNAIRAIDPNNLIVIGTPLWCLFPSVAIKDPVQGEHLTYSLHFYPGDENHRQGPMDRTKATLDAGKSVFVSEFGVVHSSGGGDVSVEWSNRWFDFMEEHRISWANWSICLKQEGASAVRPNAPTKPTAATPWITEGSNSHLTASGRFVYDKLIAAAAKDQTSIAYNFTGVRGKTPAWSLTAGVNGLTLRGPVEAGAKVTLYDIRGRVVTHAPLGNGQPFVLNKKNVSAGSYLLVVKSNNGAPLYRTRVSLVN